MSDDEVTLGMSIPLHSDGFLRRECPTCEREFKWLPNTNDEDDADDGEPLPSGCYLCPYCGVQAPADAECIDCEAHTGACRGDEQRPSVAECHRGRGSRSFVGEERAQSRRHLVGIGDVEEAVDVAGILGFEALRRCEAVTELVELGDEQRAGTGDVDGHAADVASFERGDLDRAVIDDRAFDARTLTCGGLPMIARKSCCAAPGLRRELLGNDQINGYDDLVFDPGS